MARLPVELYENVIKLCSRSDLITLAGVSRTMQPEAERILYRDVKFPQEFDTPANARGALMSAVMFSKRICQSSRRAAYVISLQARLWSGSHYYSLVALRNLFSRAMARMPHLRTLRFLKADLLEFSILTQSHFKLWTFESDLPDLTTLFRFLSTQGELRSLSLWLLLPMANEVYYFPPHILPGLTVLIASARNASLVMPGRPISHLCILDHPTHFFANPPIGSSAAMIKVLRVSSVLHTTMGDIARALPNVEVLYVNHSIVTFNQMKAFVITISLLKNLRILELRFRPRAYWSSALGIAQAIIEACHSLHTLILNEPFFSNNNVKPWWIWKSGMSEIEPGEGNRDVMQLWNEEVAKLGL